MKALILTLAALAGIHAQARPQVIQGQEGYGGGLCAHAEIYCKDEADTALVCLFEKQVPAFAIVEYTRNGVREGVNVDDIYQVPADGRIGAPLEFKAPGFHLSMITDAAPNAKGIPSALVLSKMHVEVDGLYCKFQNQK